MSKIAVMIDTSFDMTYELAEQYGIYLVSYQLQMGEKHLKDQIDIQSRTFYEEMHHYETLSTGIPPIQDVIDKYEEIKQDGFEEVIVLTSSHKITGMRGLHEVAKEDIEGLNIHVIDTEHIASSALLLAIYAKDLVDEGKSAQEILSAVDKHKSHTAIFALFRTLKYLVKGGRFSKYKGAVGTLLNVQPLLGIVEGEVGVLDKVRGRNKSLLAMVARIKEYIGNSQRYRIAMFSGNNAEEIEKLKIHLQAELAKAELVIETELTPVLGVHAGPESIGISVMKLDA